ncbi:hypothetical protein FOA43_001913 [Brettanomyces nanus]|uniref:NAD(P)-binding domain-containing protein n=1 Tax=Eeniella nana TaxID=13502 RepID=A0A875S3E2_EENNA|nr:uncharacterized protein FOA43_001913 [Brettanomyces nanus]QPG74582.1 hypothetical protein FOA43_001913 [Brettanomyces nanus]
MRKYVLTGVDGYLGSVAADFALTIKKPNQKLVFTSYDPEKIPAETRKRYVDAGAEVKHLSYDNVDEMVAIFKDAEAVSFISTWLIGEGRRRQHGNVINSAVEAGVKRICYTSFVGADLEKDLPVLPQDHKYTEQLIFKSGLTYTIQRDYLYADNIINYLAPSWNYCGAKWLNNSGNVPAAYVCRKDCGRVLGALLMGKGEPNTIYAITGPKLVTDQEYFDKICAASGYKGELVPYTDEQLYEYWGKQGCPRDVEDDANKNKSPMKLVMDDLVSTGEVVRRGLMSEANDNIKKLTGREPSTIDDVIKALKDVWPKNE